MKKYDKKSAIKIIVHAAKEYEEKLNNKHFLIVYQKKSLTKTVEIGFRDMNFLHLTGVKTNENVTRRINFEHGIGGGYASVLCSRKI